MNRQTLLAIAIVVLLAVASLPVGTVGQTSGGTSEELSHSTESDFGGATLDNMSVDGDTVTMNVLKTTEQWTTNSPGSFGDPVVTTFSGGQVGMIDYPYLSWGYDETDGSFLWQYDGGDTEGHESMAANNETVLVAIEDASVGGDNDVNLFDRSGTQVGHLYNDVRYCAAATDGWMYLLRSGNTIELRSPTDLGLVWGNTSAPGSGVALSEDYAITNYNDNITIWDADTGAYHDTYTGHTGAVNHYDIRGEMVVVGTDAGEVHAFNATSGTELWTYTDPDVSNPEHINVDADLVAFMSGDNATYLGTDGGYLGEKYHNSSGTFDVWDRAMVGTIDGGQTIWRYDVALRETASYQHEHSAVNPGEGYVDLDIRGMDATIEWQGNDSGSWTTVAQQTVSTSGEHTADLSGHPYSEWRVVVTFDRTSGADSWGATVNEEGVRFETAGPTLSNPSPVNGTRVDSQTIDLSVDVSDPDFATAQDDEVAVDFWIKPAGSDSFSSAGSDTLTQNGTATTTVTNDVGGDFEWFANASDSYGTSTETNTMTATVPGTLYIYNESAPDTLVDGATVEIQFYGGEEGDAFVVQRQTTDGAVDMSGLPADQEFVVVADAAGYHNRRIYIENLFAQQQIFLLPESQPSVYNVFQLEDRSGSYPPGETRLIIQRGLNRSGNFSWHTVSGDFFGGTNSHETNLRQDQRYRLIIVNSDGDRRMIGSYMAFDENNPKIITVSSIVVNPPSGQSYYATAWIEDGTEDDGQKTLRFSYSDPESLTDRLDVVIYERHNESNELVNVSTTSVGSSWTLSETLTGNETNATWVVDWSGQRDGETIGQTYPIGEEGEVPIPMDPAWLANFGLVALPIVAALASERIATLGAMGTVAFAGILMITGIWEIPVILWFAALVIAVGGHGLTMARRGSVYG